MAANRKNIFCAACLPDATGGSGEECGVNSRCVNAQCQCISGYFTPSGTHTDCQNAIGMSTAKPSRSIIVIILPFQIQIQCVQSMILNVYTAGLFMKVHAESEFLVTDYTISVLYSYILMFCFIIITDV